MPLFMYDLSQAKGRHEEFERWDACAEDGDVDFDHGPYVDLFVPEPLLEVC